MRPSDDETKDEEEEPDSSDGNDRFEDEDAMTCVKDINLQGRRSCPALYELHQRQNQGGVSFAEKSILVLPWKNTFLRPSTNCFALSVHPVGCRVDTS